MKRIFIIFLASLVLIVVGIVGYTVSVIPAYSAGADIFYGLEFSDDGYCRTFDNERGSIIRAVIDVQGADVYVIERSENNKIELYNFPDRSYTFSANNRTLSFDNTSSEAGLWSGILNYRGLREYVNYALNFGKNRIVKIYIADGEQIENFDVNVSSGEIIYE